jgi:hypothetical protein
MEARYMSTLHDKGDASIIAKENSSSERKRLI